MLSITVNGQETLVRQSLLGALVGVASTVRASECLLWVDALCINQDDSLERSQQVQLMKILYERAHSVLSWLGNPQDEEKAANAIALMKLVRHFHQDMKGNWRLLVPQQRLKLSSDHPLLDELNTDLAVEACAAIREIFSKPYWSRTWIHQEITLPDVVFCYGTTTFAWTHIFTLRSLAYYQSHEDHQGMPEHLFRLLKRSARLSPSLENLCTAYYNRRAVIKHGRKQMSQALPLIRQLRLTQCADARDKVFAALPHAYDIKKEDREALMDLGYARSLIEVYIGVVKISLASDDDLEFLGYVYRSRASSATVEPPRDQDEVALPTWVPDWRSQTSLLPLNCTGYLNASYDIIYKPCPATTNLDARIVGSELHVRGFLFDSIQSLCSSTGGDMHDLQDLRRSWQAELNSVSAQYDDETFDRTVVADARCFRSQEAQRSVNWRGHSVDWDLLSLDQHTLDIHRLSLRTQMWDALSTICTERRMGYTRNGKLGIFPAAAMAGDSIAAFHGGNALYVIRFSNTQPNKFEFVGECYLDGMMDGKVFNYAREHGVVADMLVLV